MLLGRLSTSALPKKEVGFPPPRSEREPDFDFRLGVKERVPVDAPCEVVEVVEAVEVEDGVCSPPLVARVEGTVCRAQAGCQRTSSSSLSSAFAEAVSAVGIWACLGGSASNWRCKRFRLRVSS
mmetsp:Transcript_64/g.132  ORF Transcript_64/g.132 Transcript_64/m.132 type:complete len:124 (+) Transcript_64:527-898(+)